MLVWVGMVDCRVAEVFEMVVLVVWASWCAPQVWLSFQLHSLKSFFFFRDIDWLCDQHLSHESGRTIFGGLPEVHGLGLFLVLGLY